MTSAGTGLTRASIITLKNKLIKLKYQCYLAHGHAEERPVLIKDIKELQAFLSTLGLKGEG